MQHQCDSCGQPCTKRSRRCLRCSNGSRATPLLERFWPKVDKSGACWVWIAGCNSNGYGRFSTSTNHAELAHRVSWKLHFGPIPECHSVLHRCDNPPCVNPTHLFLGTTAENMADMSRKGRGRTAIQGPYLGKLRRTAKLSREDVRAIRLEHANGGTTYAKLGQRYGVSGSLVFEILTGKVWRWLD